eukprot:TRINITY_DN19564_c0_g1_i1.p2 TRINITY_DN19564_c0_g1~~TRINITY_DN19564_c0_g1_i1.p2  ORF type:complete len:267 (-),score=76.89 TRINITY_DN19564_c0_g1_i1:1150-1950(-)
MFSNVLKKVQKPKAQVKSELVDKRVRKGGAGAARAEPASSGSQDTVTNVEEVVKLLAKLSLTTARDVALLKSATMSVCLFRHEMAPTVVNTMKETSNGYHQRVKQLSPKQQQQECGPHVYVWLALCEMLMQTDEKNKAAVLAHQRAIELEVEEMVADKKEAEKEAREAAGKSGKAMVDMEVEEESEMKERMMKECVERVVPLVRLATAFDKNLMKVEGIAVEHALPVMKGLFRLLCVQAKGQMKHSVAPRGDLERKLAKYLQSVAR